MNDIRWVRSPNTPKADGQVLGKPSPFQKGGELASKMKLQYKDLAGNWVDVPIVDISA